MRYLAYFSFFFFNDTATTEIYTLSLHDALPIWQRANSFCCRLAWSASRSSRRRKSNSCTFKLAASDCLLDRKSTRLNSSHSQISYAVFCLKKKNKSHRLTTSQDVGHRF